jgi:hypothetical protein
MIAQKQSHVHKFDKPSTKKVLLNSGLKTAIDIIKLRVCSCGKTEAYDLERTIK